MLALRNSLLKRTNVYLVSGSITLSKQKQKKISHKFSPRCLFYSTTSIIDDWRITTKQNDPIITHDTITSSQFNLLANTLDTDIVQPVPNATPIPPCWHHVYFPPRTREQDLASDGYETDYFPPPPYSQRMWVGASMHWNQHNTLAVGDEATMTTSLDDVQEKHGRMGLSAMVWINKDITNEKGFSMQEKRCLVYHPSQPHHQEAVASRGIQVKKNPAFHTTITPSSILLFRYSALTFNSHKIHFDHMYATQQENHPACLVHGPLSGTWMMELLRKQTADFITDFEYKCLMPLYVNQPLTVAGRPTANDPQRYELWITNHQGYLAVKGSATTVKCQ